MALQFNVSMLINIVLAVEAIALITTILLLIIKKTILAKKIRIWSFLIIGLCIIGAYVFAECIPSNSNWCMSNYASIVIVIVLIVMWVHIVYLLAMSRHSIYQNKHPIPIIYFVIYTLAFLRLLYAKWMFPERYILRDTSKKPNIDPKDLQRISALKPTNNDSRIVKVSLLNMVIPKIPEITIPNVTNQMTTAELLRRIQYETMSSIKQEYADAFKAWANKKISEGGEDVPSNIASWQEYYDYIYDGNDLRPYATRLDMLHYDSLRYVGQMSNNKTHVDDPDGQIRINMSFSLRNNEFKIFPQSLWTCRIDVYYTLQQSTAADGLSNFQDVGTLRTSMMASDNIKNIKDTFMEDFYDIEWNNSVQSNPQKNDNFKYYHQGVDITNKDGKIGELGFTEESRDTFSLQITVRKEPVKGSSSVPKEPASSKK